MRVISKIANPDKPSNTLSCFACSTIDDPMCRVLNTSTEEIQKIIPIQECDLNEKYCLVTRVEYLTGDAKKRTFWGLDRGCSKTCIEGCILIGKKETAEIYL
ncbi:hypothetical protein B4U79_04430 [Dinothrombium tinctorium]|uniref:Protein quiver n=1 Tax=Dinothrombium tinctorium TaxID=1965070 RepID=A0A443QX67_9ACAR|nr:hypothetical protein B4U79_04430 [Dinothrombium tinctorium]